MSPPGLRWFHITFGTHGSWLPGDPRGFRSRNTKNFSSGDHRNPPPSKEHEGLLRHSKKLTPSVVTIPKPLLPIVGNAIGHYIQQYSYRVNAVCVASRHVHLLAELPVQNTTAEVGKIKRYASFAIRDQMNGRVWATGCGVKPIHDKAHQVNAFNYILQHRGQRCWVWSFREGVRGE